MRTSDKRQYTSTPRKARPAGEQRRPAAGREPQWLVVSAWAPELASLRRAVPHLPVPIRRNLTMGSVGVGLVDAAAGTARLLEEIRPGGVILVGTAGLYPAAGQGLRLADAVVADEIALLPDVTTGRHTYLPEVMSRQVSATPGLSEAIRNAASLAAVDVACPLAITASAPAARNAAKSSHCAVENLEAFAVARAAAGRNIPFAAVLGIANHVGPAAHREWKQNSARAAAAACQAVLTFLGAWPR